MSPGHREGTIVGEMPKAEGAEHQLAEMGVGVRRYTSEGQRGANRRCLAFMSGREQQQIYEKAAPVLHR